MVYGILFWIATLVLVLGVANKVWLYSRIPAPLKIPTMPAPRTLTGVLWRMARELLLFQSLFRADKLLWAISMVFHYALLLVVIRHLRYVQEPIWSLVIFLQPFGKYAGFALVLSLSGLLARRFLIDRVRYISAPSDFLMLVLLIFIACSGLMMRYVNPTDIVMVKAFFVGLKTFNWQPLPSDITLLLHLFAVAFLMLIFPISKLMHAPGVFFSPTRNQVDNSRERRHIASWAAELEKDDRKK
ncbi:nitrate reductase [Leucothrix arctica]|uniref:Nitrate reductase n=1 Tax=Leucothrix arctica TaxID=1481894 RepID=A0A317CJS9_9GAMM|nr:nitrate reductase [Leucothrix arctica]